MVTNALSIPPRPRQCTVRILMTGRRAGASLGIRLLAPLPLLLLGGCDALRLGAVNAAGPIAAGEWHLYTILAIALIFVAGPVLVLTPIIAWHYRLSNKRDSFRTQWNYSPWLEGLIWIPPAGIVIGLAVLLWTYTVRLDPYRPIASAQPALEVQAVGLDWKWLFVYPGERIAAVNRLVIPAGRPIRISLTSGTVMQSLLIPRLAGQIYAMPGMRTQLNLAADRPGIYRGANVQFNGAGFQDQRFDVVALPPAAYENWLARVRNLARPLDAVAYAGLFERSTLPPTFYSAVPDRLFQQILVRSQSSPERPR